jgi:hypothetical protein
MQRLGLSRLRCREIHGLADIAVEIVEFEMTVFEEFE